MLSLQNQHNLRHPARNHKSIFITSLESKAQPLSIPLANGGEAFWLDDRTVGHAVTNEESKKLELYALHVNYETELAPGPPVLIANFPTSTATNFKYASESGRLVFSDSVYPDGNLTTVKEQDEAWENRGTSALVYDSGYERYVLVLRKCWCLV